MKKKHARTIAVAHFAELLWAACWILVGCTFLVGANLSFEGSSFWQVVFRQIF